MGDALAPLSLICLRKVCVLICSASLYHKLFRGWTLLGKESSLAYAKWVNLTLGAIFASLFDQKAKLHFSQLYQLKKKIKKKSSLYINPFMTQSVLNSGEEE